jgi:predicted dithiol-disulfide oxidoreductase (DUF899 family)
VEHRVVSHDEWVKARVAFLAREKEFTHLRDQLNAERRALPWEAVTKEYVFVGPTGRRTLRDLFDGQSQLVVYHFMFGPDWDAGCPHCSFWADNYDGVSIHLKQRDVAFAAVSRAPHPKIAAFQERMGWSFTWVSSFETDFNHDYHVSFEPEEMTGGTGYYNYVTGPTHEPEREGISVFAKGDADAIFHTYSTYARGIDMINGAYHILDLTPTGRDEAGHDNPQFWVRFHDEY